jgi:hypothetical protein
MTTARSTRTNRTTFALAAVLGACVVAGSLNACADTKSAGSSGNVVVDDTREQPRPPPNPDPPIDANIPDAPLYDALGNYAPLTACNGCTCSGDTHFCFGGGTPRGLAGPGDGGTDEPTDASVDAGDGGLPLCPVPSNPATVQVGCNALPAACAADPTCACVLTAIQPAFRCYLVCQNTSGLPQVYCPAP